MQFTAITVFEKKNNNVAEKRVVIMQSFMYHTRCKHTDKSDNKTCLETSPSILKHAFYDNY